MMIVTIVILAVIFNIGNARNRCQTFSETDLSPRIMITDGGGHLGIALMNKLKQMNFTSVKIICDSKTFHRLRNVTSAGKSGEYMDLGYDNICVGDLSSERVSRHFFVNSDWVIHLASTDSENNTPSRVKSPRFNRIIHIDSMVLRSVIHNNISHYLYTVMKHPRSSNYSDVGIYDTQITRNSRGISNADPFISHKQFGEVPQHRNNNASILGLNMMNGGGVNYQLQGNSHEIPFIIWKAITETNGEFTIANNSIQATDNAFVDNVVNSIVSAIQMGGFQGERQIGSGSMTALGTVTGLISHLTQRCLNKTVRIHIEKIADEFRRSEATTLHKGLKELSLAQNVPVDVGIAKTYAWILNDMAHKNDVNETLYLKYAKCLDDEVREMEENLLTTQVVQVEGFKPPSGIISDSLPIFFCPNDRQSILDSIKDIKMPRKTLIILTSSTRAQHITFENFQHNVLNILDADLALSIEAKDSSTPDGFRRAAKYIWEINPPKDFDFMHFYDEISMKCFNHSFNESYAGIIGSMLPFEDQSSGWLGCIKAAKQRTCCAQMLFYRWYAMQNIMKEKLYLHYDTVIMSRSDFYWVGPHEVLAVERGNVYVPYGKGFGGIYDRHYLLNMYDAISALAHAEIVVERNDPYEQRDYLISKGYGKVGNLERAHLFWLRDIRNLTIQRYSHSGLLVSDASDGGYDRWSVLSKVCINGLWVWAKYAMELDYLKQFNLTITNVTALNS